MKNILLLALLGLFAINTHQQEYDEEEHSHLRGRGGRGGKGGKGGSWASRINGRTLSRTGHAIQGGVGIADTIHRWTRGHNHFANDDEESFE